MHYPVVTQFVTLGISEGEIEPQSPAASEDAGDDFHSLDLIAPLGCGTAASILDDVLDQGLSGGSESR
jgi:hypothetical protein